MNPFAFLTFHKTLIEAIAIGAVIVGIGIGIHRFLEYERDIGYQRAVAEYTSAALVAEKAAQAREAALVKQIQEARDELSKNQETIRILSAANATVYNGLLDTTNDINKRLPGLAADALRDVASTYGVVFAECQTRRREVAEDAERLNAEKRALMDAWAK